MKTNILMHSLSDYITIQDQAQLLNLLSRLANNQVKETDLCFIGEGRNFIVFCIDFKETKWCMKVQKEAREDKVNNIVEALLVCSKFELYTNRIVYADSSLTILNVPYYIQSYVDGITLDRMLNSMPNEKQADCFYDLGCYMAKMHQIKSNYFRKDIIEGNQKIEFSDYLYKKFVKLKNVIEVKSLFNDSLLSDVEKLVTTLIRTIDFYNVQPAFVHRDISLTNIIVKNNKFVSLIDFEHACYIDPVWDFTKPSLDMFHRYPLSKDKILEGYSSITSITESKGFKERFTLYYILELLWGIINDYENSRNRYVSELKNLR